MAHPPRLSRRAFLVGAGAVTLGHPVRAGGAAAVEVETWRGVAPGTTGIPPGWEPYATPGGHPAYDFRIAADAGRPVLHMRSHGDHSTIAHKLAITLRETPHLEWSWKMLALPRGGDVRRKATSDAAGHVFVVWPRFPALLRSRLIGYVWDATAPVGTIVESRKTSTVTFVVVRSGADGLGRWWEERRDVLADYRRIHGEPPEEPAALALSIDTNDTRSSAETLVGPLAFRA